MNSQTPADQLSAQLAFLHQTRTLWEQQPAVIQRQYESAADTLSQALTGTYYTFSLQLPHELIQENSVLRIDPSLVFLRAGGILQYLQRKTCKPALIHLLTNLQNHQHHTVSAIARLVCFLTARRLLLEHVPTETQIAQLTAFNSLGELIVSDDEAAVIITRLGNAVDALHNIETLFPALSADEIYNQKYAVVVTALIAQGRALADHQTHQIIIELQARWQQGEIIRGLILFIPYLDERQLQMQLHEMVVMPAGRITFRPEFVVSACRLAQQHVRKSSTLSQSTRWQLIARLDLLAQAFDIEKL